MKNNIKPILNSYINKYSDNYIYGVSTILIKIKDKSINFFNKRIVIEKHKVVYYPIIYTTSCKSGITKEEHIRSANEEINNRLKLIKNNSIISFNLFNNIFAIGIADRFVYDTNKVKEIINNVELE